MAALEHQDLVSTFIAVTGADDETAKHVLEAHAWDLNNSVEFFLEQGANHCPPAQPLGAQPASIDDHILADGDPGAISHRPVPQTRIEPSDDPVLGRPFVPHQSIRENEDPGRDDTELQRALAASVRDAGDCAGALGKLLSGQVISVFLDAMMNFLADKHLAVLAGAHVDRVSQRGASLTVWYPAMEPFMQYILLIFEQPVTAMQ
jgi:hypothetical protein